ncbi:hypothetical protein [Streptomyces phaeochromogenes]|uniref:hypothetical protein n=1 Tax=Streptomyces phaeochromogenes TaxID=1923 RepID=UPI003862EF0C|nr:hypothetical protein OG277_26285 [Streptomyces phaeochromogenes]
MSMRNRQNIRMRTLQAALGSLTAVALMAGIPATAHAGEAGADLAAVEGEVTDPALFAEFDADFEGIEVDADGIDASAGADAAIAASGVWKRYSWKCSSSTKKFNISIGYRGPASQTIYFNNHCSQKRSVRMHYRGQEPGGEPIQGSNCMMTVNPETKGKKKFLPSNNFPWYKGTSNC